MMQFGLLHQAQAAANLSNLGWSPQDIKGITVEWSKRQRAQSLGAVVQELGELDVTDDIGTDCAGRMFLSFHYSVYPAVYRSLGRQSTDRTIYSLIGQQTLAHCKALQDIAGAHGINIRFVQSGFRMISEMRSALRKGFTGLALLDVPWSKTNAIPDKFHVAFGGSFASLSTLERLMDVIDNQREIVTAARCGRSGVRVTRLGGISYSDAFFHLGALIERDPSDYERLHQFHRFFSFDCPHPILISFRTNGQRYAVLGPSMRIMKMDSDPSLDKAEMTRHGLCDEKRLADLLRKKIGTDFEHILCL